MFPLENFIWRGCVELDKGPVSNKMLFARPRELTALSTTLWQLRVLRAHKPKGRLTYTIFQHKRSPGWVQCQWPKPLVGEAAAYHRSSWWLPSSVKVFLIMLCPTTGFTKNHRAVPHHLLKNLATSTFGKDETAVILLRFLLTYTTFKSRFISNVMALIDLLDNKE